MGFPLWGRGRAFAMQRYPAGGIAPAQPAGLPLAIPPPTTTSGCRGLESSHSHDEQAPHLVRYGACSSRVVNGSRTRRDSAIIFGKLKNKNVDISMFLFYQYCKKMPFLAVYCSVRLTTQTNGILMLGSCLLWEIFRMTPSSFWAGKNLDKRYNASAVVILIPLVSYSLLFML